MAAKGAQVQTLFANRSEPSPIWIFSTTEELGKSLIKQNLVDSRLGESRFSWSDDEMRGGFASAGPLLGLLPLLLSPSLGWAANATKLPSTVEPGHEQQTLPAVPEGNFEFSIPTPRKTPIPQDVENLRFSIQEINVEGMTVFNADDVAPILKPLIGEDRTLRQVMDAAEAIEEKYRTYSCLMARAFVPQQRTKNGVFTIKVVEGYIKNINVEGVDGNLKSRIQSMLLGIKAERPVTTGTVERALLLVNQLPGIKATGLLKPSSKDAGAADLDLTVAHKKIEGTAGIDNRGSKYSGPIVANLDLGLNSIFGMGEQIGVGVTKSADPRKQIGYRAHYTQPLGDSGLVSQTTFDHSNAMPGWTLKNLKVKTTTNNIGQRVQYPVELTRKQTVTIDAGFTAKSAKTEMLGAPYSNDKWRVADIKASWSENGWMNGGTAASVGVAKGVPMAGSSRSGDPNLSRTNANPDFTKIIMDAKRIQPMTSDVSLQLGAAGQYAANKLLSGEEFTLGGNQFGRGFDPSALTGDHGVAGSAEMQYDARTGMSAAENAQLYSFYDQGVVWTRGGTDGKQMLSSTGVGVRSIINQSVSMGLEYAHALHGPDPTVSADPGRVFFSLQGKF